MLGTMLVLTSCPGDAGTDHSTVLFKTGAGVVVLVVEPVPLVLVGEPPPPVVVVVEPPEPAPADALGAGPVTATVPPGVPASWR